MKFKLVTTGEAVKDDRTTAVDVTFGCKEGLVKFVTTVETFTFTMLDDDKTELVGSNTELDNIATEPLNDGVTKELELVTALLTV